MFGLTTLGPERAELVKRYRHWRSVSKEFNNAVIKDLHAGAIDEGGRKLGIMKGKTLVFDSEAEVGMLMDYCMYEVFRDGKNVVDVMLEAGKTQGEERVVLEAMRRSRYAIFEVVKAEPGVGMEVKDFLRGDRLFLLDVNLSQTARPEMVLASRLLCIEDIWMSTGAMLPVTPAAEEALRERVAQWIEKNQADWAGLSREEEADFVRGVVRTCWKENQGVELAYEDPGEARALPAVSEKAVGRNEPCPCGSGKKYKRCCGG